MTQVTIVDADGVIYRQVYGENFDLPMLVQPLKELLSGQAPRQMSRSTHLDQGEAVLHRLRSGRRRLPD